MCGIAGFELGPDHRSVAERLFARLGRRGPDGQWYTPVGDYGLLQTRLAVIDLSARVRYPMKNETGDLHLLFNGEIYDFDRHRADLQRRGHRFSTDCDAEVVLHGFEEFGTSLFSRLDGMFAIALLHSPSGELLLVRDAVGIKPLSYTSVGRFAFCSDAMALVGAGLSRGTLEPTAAAEFLSREYLLPPATGIADLRQLSPGEMLRRSVSGAVVVEQWRRKPFSSAPSGPRPTAEEAGEALDASVRRQLVADRTVGVLVSGGLDSALVLESAVRAGAAPVALTIGFSGHGDYDEAPAARRLAGSLGAPHVVRDSAIGFVEAVEMVCDAYDVPLGDPSAVATMELARLAREHATVVLTGTGGDDLFAGYFRHRAHLLLPLLNRLPRSVARRLARSGGTVGGERRSLVSLARSYAARLAATHGEGPLGQYQLLTAPPMSAVIASTVSPWARPEAISKATAQSLAGRQTTLRNIQALEFSTYVPGDLLLKEDRASMAFGIEARVPLLGAELVAIAERAADDQKIGLRRGKRLLREIGSRRLPSGVSTSTKRGFAMPLSDLFRDSWREEAADWLHAQSSTLVDGGRVASLFEQRQLTAKDVWLLSVLAGWEQAVRAARVSGSHG